VISHLGIDLYVDEAYYWGWSQNLDWGYFSKPPVIAALIAASTALLGNGLIAIKLPSLLLYPATAFALYALGRACIRRGSASGPGWASCRCRWWRPSGCSCPPTRRCCCAGRWPCSSCCGRWSAKAGPTGWPAAR
jgi:hypothetical protein